MSQTWHPLAWPAARLWLEALLGELTEIPEPGHLKVEPSKDLGALEQILVAGGVDVNELMATMPKWEGMHFVKLPNSLSRDLTPLVVVFRKHVVNVVKEVLACLMAGDCVLVSGSPGVGKSVSLLPCLVRGLVEGGGGRPPSVIIIYDQGLGAVVKLRFSVTESSKAPCGFISTLTSSDRISTRDYDPLTDPDLSDGKDTVLIVDPSNTAAALPGSLSSAPVRTVFVASPNSDHFTDFKKQQDPMPVFVKHWTLQELRAALKYIGDNMTPINPDWTEQDKLAAWEQVAVHRWLRQGGNPRAVLRRAETFDDLEETTDAWAGDMDAGVLHRILENPIGVPLDATLKYMANSALVTYCESKHPFRLKNTVVVFKSDSVVERIAAKFFSTMMTHIRLASCEQRTSCGHLFERLALWAVRGGNTFEVIQKWTGTC